MKPLNALSVVVILLGYLGMVVCGCASSPNALELWSGFPLIDGIYIITFGVGLLQAIKTPNVTNLEDNFVFYCSYHHNFINKLIHVLCVWPIVWTHIAMFTYATRLISLPVILPYQPSSLAWAATLSTLGWVTYWLVLDKKSGWLAAMLVVACLFSAQYFTESFGDRGYVIASWIHLACWIMQFVGHGIFEGRSPSLLDNLAQSFLMAPYFCFLEVCFWLGFRTDFREKTTPIILRRIREFDLKKSR